MPLTVFDLTGIPAHRRGRIESAVVAGGKNVSGPGPHAPGKRISPKNSSYATQILLIAMAAATSRVLLDLQYRAKKRVLAHI